MTVMKLDYRLNGDVSDALAPHIERIYDRPGSTFVAVVEFRHTSRLELADEVKCRAVKLEVANPGEQEQHVRSLHRALYLQRTAQGTLDDAGEVKLSKQTIAQAAGLAGGTEVARVRAVLDWTATALHEATANTSLREADLRKALDKVQARLAAALRGEQLEMDGKA
jgi:hypothetical protein